ncbi:MAG: toxin-antitoxin system HicB family antitoxin [Gammaproteobacteria bacterium]|nr:toxin-antitoxin system HicB family antitoxin [Gammaproteobacteria bacterium]
MTIDAHTYNITVRRGDFDGETLFEARVRELPDLVEYGESYDEAYELAVDAVETTAEAWAEQGRTLPRPIEPADDYSGRVTLRIAKSFHRALVEAAEAEGVSLNQHLVNVLTYYSGFAAGQRHEGGSPWESVGRPAMDRTKSRRHLRLVRATELSEVV